jgi:hypothetical protein
MYRGLFAKSRQKVAKDLQDCHRILLTWNVGSCRLCLARLLAHESLTVTGFLSNGLLALLLFRAVP